MFRNSREKIEVRFTEISNVTVIARVQINKKGADLFIKGIFRSKQSAWFALRSKNYFLLSNCKKSTVLSTLLTKQDLNCNDFLPRNGRRQVNCFLGANKNTSS